MTENTEGHRDWAAVERVMKARMRKLKMSTAQLARDTGLSETTIRYVGRGDKTESPLVAIAAVLGWRFDYLRNILHGKPEKNKPAPSDTRESNKSILEASFRDLLSAELGPIKESIAALQVSFEKMDRKIGRLAPPDDDVNGPV